LTAAHGRLLSVSVTQPKDAADVIHAFATFGDDNLIRVLVIRLRAGGPDTVTVGVAGPSPTRATLVRLHAASLDASTGLSLGGTTWDGSSDGKPIGALVEEPVSRAGDGWRFQLPPYDAVVLTLSP
jgi:hypothetical protein